ncbi:hypothetical protein OQA88_5698 [Cercophora sp. LCS_1]
MGWRFWSWQTPSNEEGKSNATSPAVAPQPPPKRKNISWNDSLNRENWDHYTEPRTLVLQGLLVAVPFAAWLFYRSYLKRLPAAGHITHNHFRRRSLLGKVTSVGDGDGFRLFHTPGGRLAGWGWLRSVPTSRKDLGGRTISIRLAGVDAPEGAHFGQPAQPYAAEAKEFLKSYILGRRVRAYIYRRDQYERVVATVYVRKPPFFIKKDVSLQLLKRGLATIYEGKTGAEFGGAKTEKAYREAEATAKRKKIGMWSIGGTSFFGLGKKEVFESPKAYKDRIRQGEAGATKA